VPRLGQFISQSGRKAVGQSEDNMLNETRTIKMRKITARAPASRRSARQSRCRRDASAPALAGILRTAGLRPACRRDAGAPKSYPYRRHP
jgi:hypothetical protein